MTQAKPQTYLADLEQRLSCGVRRLPPRFRRRQADFIARAQNADGGFSGRQGGSDLYYSSFGVRAAALLADEVQVDLWPRAADYLRGTAPRPQDAVGCFCALAIHRELLRRDYGAMNPEPFAEALESLRAPEGGYAALRGGPTSVYHTFLASLCYELLERPMPCPQGACVAVLRNRSADGGFADTGERTTGESGVNPSAAAVGLLASHGALAKTAAREAANFLGTMQGEDGSFRAHAKAPVGDVMSSFTALAALGGIGALQTARLRDAARFIRRQAAQDGGFRAVVADDMPDIEYTYYGVAALALLAQIASRCC